LAANLVTRPVAQIERDSKSILNLDSWSRMKRCQDLVREDPGQWDGDDPLRRRWATRYEIDNAVRHANLLVGPRESACISRKGIGSWPVSEGRVQARTNRRRCHKAVDNVDAGPRRC
jgi:hypothetical protein